MVNAAGYILVLSPSSPDDLVAAEALATSCLLTAGTPELLIATETARLEISFAHQNQ